MTETEDVPPGVDPTTPSPARLYDYFLGGTNYLPVDKMVAERLEADLPDIVDGIWANRGFHGRAAVWMARQGIRQFIDIGSGLPTQNNTHEAVQKIIQGARVAYIDNDPMVAARGNALLAADGTTTVITADVRDPDALLGHRKLRATIDITEPTGVLLTSVMHFVADESDPMGPGGPLHGRRGPRQLPGLVARDRSQDAPEHGQGRDGSLRERQPNGSTCARRPRLSGSSTAWGGVALRWRQARPDLCRPVGGRGR